MTTEPVPAADDVRINQAAYDNLRQRIILAQHNGTKSRVNAEAQLAFLERYNPNGWMGSNHDANGDGEM